MASIQEQIKHIRAAHEDSSDEQRRSVFILFPRHRDSILIEYLACRLIGEFAQGLSRRTSPNPRSFSSTPHPEIAVSSHESESNRSRPDEVR